MKCPFDDNDCENERICVLINDINGKEIKSKCDRNPYL